MLAVIASMERELAGLRKGLQDICAQRQAAPCPVELHVAGVGGADSRECVESLLDQNPRTGPMPDGLLFLGFAGALDPALRTGDLVIPQRFYSADPNGHAGYHLIPDPVMYRASVEAAERAGLPGTHLDSLTVDEVITSCGAKSALRLLYPVGIVDMEDYPVALAARKSGVPFLSVRVVLDVANQGLPAYLPGMARSPTGAAVSAAAMPWRIPALYRLARQMAAAQRVLTRFALAYIQTLWEDERTLRQDERSLAGPTPVDAAAGRASGLDG